MVAEFSWELPCADSNIVGADVTVISFGSGEKKVRVTSEH